MTGATQDKMRTEHHIKSHHMMQKINICSFLILGTGELVLHVTVNDVKTAK